VLTTCIVGEWIALKKCNPVKCFVVNIIIIMIEGKLRKGNKKEKIWLDRSFQGQDMYFSQEQGRRRQDEGWIE
jgi:hypothetical protein